MELLRAKTSQFLREQLHPHRTYTEPDPESDKHIVRVHLDRHPAVRWGVYIGDIVHNLRSALDHIAWQLAALEGPPPGQTEFPIFADESRFRTIDKKGDPGRRSGLYKMVGIGDCGKALIEWAQPYHRRSEAKSAPLWMLHELWNADKHRVLAVAIASLEASGYHYRVLTPKGKLAEFEFGPFGPLHEGAQVAWFRIAEDSVRPVDVQITVTYAVTFGEATNAKGDQLPTVGKPLMRTLDAMGRAVGSVLLRAQLCFEEDFFFWPVKTTEVGSLDELLARANHD